MHVSKSSLCSLTSVRPSVSLSSVICDWLRTIKPTKNKLQPESNKTLTWVCESWEYPSEQD